MKKTSKFQFVTTVLFMALLLFIDIANAAGNINIQQLKEAQQLDKINSSGKNIFRTLKKTIIEENLIKELENSTKIEAFINDVATNKLSLYNVPRLSKSLVNKVKQFVISGNITPAKGDELVRKLKGLQRSTLVRNVINICSECNEECDLSKFILANLGNSYETEAISANDNTNMLFLKSQDAIVQKNHANMVQSFDACLPEINRLIDEMPDIKSCKPKNCEECYSIYYDLYTEYLFLKKYMIIQKGYFLLKNGKYSEAEAYFRNAQQSTSTPPTVTMARINMGNERKAIIKWHADALKITLNHFIGRCLYEQGNYTEALSYFNNGGFFNMPKLPLLAIGYDHDTEAMFNVYPYSGLYSDFCQYGDDLEKRNHIGKSIFWVWQNYYFSGICQYKLGNKKEALAFFKTYIGSTDKEFEDEAKKLIAELETEPNVPVPIEISEIKFLRKDGTEVKWGDILEINQEYTIQAISKGLCSESVIKIGYSSNYTNGIWNLQKIQSGNIYQTTIMVDSSIIGLNPDNKWRFVAFDYLPDEKSNLGDSKLFIEKAKNQMNYVDGGYFQASSSEIPNEVKGDFSNPVLPITNEAFMAAGVEYLKLEIANVKRIIPFKNQANIFYYSGHGSSKDGSLLANVSFNPSDIKNNEWDNLRVVIIAGCSVLSLDIQLQIPDAAYKQDPGLKWVELGQKSKLKHFLGYRKKAPRDNQPSGFSTVLASKIICNNFFDSLKNQIAINWCSAWMGANYNSNGRNACAIELKTKEDEKNKYYYYIKITNWFGVPDHVTKIINF